MISKSSSSSSNSLFNNEVKITSDKDNNALVVTASPTDYLTVKSVIAKLDIPRDQVYVEGMMMETQIENSPGSRRDHSPFYFARKSRTL